MWYILLGRVARGTPVREKDKKYFYPSLSSGAKTPSTSKDKINSGSDQGGKDRRGPALLSAAPAKKKRQDGWSSSSSSGSLGSSGSKKKTFTNRASSPRKGRTEVGSVKRSNNR